MALLFAVFLADAVVDGDRALTDLVLQTGPLGTLVVVLGGLVRSWIAGLRTDMTDIKSKLEKHSERDGALELEVRDLARRVNALELKKAGAS